MLVVLAVDGVDDCLAVDDGDDGDEQEAEELAAEDAGGEGEGLHLEDAGGELEDLEGEGRGHHGGDGDGEELLAGEAVAELFVALAVDAFE